MNIIISGGSSGIGYETALKLSEDKKHKILVLARRKEKLEQLKNQAFNRNIEYYCVDLQSFNKNDFIQKIEQYFGNSTKEFKIDVLINNAGKLIAEPFLESSIKSWQESFQLNLFAMVELIQAVYPYFNKTVGSHIVNIGSMAGITNAEKFPTLSAYSATKAAVNSLTESLAVEFKQDNIRVNAINPGAVATEMLAQAFPNSKTKITSKMFAEQLADFAVRGQLLNNGRILQWSLEG